MKFKFDGKFLPPKAIELSEIRKAQGSMEMGKKVETVGSELDLPDFDVEPREGAQTLLDQLNSFHQGLNEMIEKEKETGNAINEIRGMSERISKRIDSAEEAGFEEAKKLIEKGRDCEICGTRFLPPTHRSRFCSAQCKSTHEQNEAERNQWVEDHIILNGVLSGSRIYVWRRDNNYQIANQEVTEGGTVRIPHRHRRANVIDIGIRIRRQGYRTWEHTAFLGGHGSNIFVEQQTEPPIPPLGEWTFESSGIEGVQRLNAQMSALGLTATEAADRLRMLAEIGEIPHGTPLGPSEKKLTKAVVKTKRKINLDG